MFDNIDASPLKHVSDLPYLAPFEFSLIYHIVVEKGFHRLFVILPPVSHGEETKDEFDVAQSFVGVVFTENGSPGSIPVQVFEQFEEFTGVDTLSNLHRAQLYATGVESLEDVIDTCVVVWVELLDDSRTKNCIVEALLIRLRQISEGFPLPFRANVLQAEYLIVETAFEEPNRRNRGDSP